MRMKELKDYCRGVKEVPATANPFAEREEVLQRLRRGPGNEARQEAAPTPAGPPPSCWTLRTIRATFEEVRNYTLSGVWRWLRRRVGVKLRSGQVQQYSPDPQYRMKLRRLLRCLKEAARDPRHTVLLFLDEKGYSVWPDPAKTWAVPAPADPPEAERQKSNNGLWRIIGSLNAWTGKLIYLDDYIVGRAKVIEMYRRISAAYPRAKTIYVVQDNWSIHTHDDVLTVLKAYPKIKPIWLPTYAPWLNPIEKLWRWLVETVLKMHRLASDWPALRDQVNSFLDQFIKGSRKLLHYVGLLGDGQLAQALNSS